MTNLIETLNNKRWLGMVLVFLIAVLLIASDVDTKAEEVPIDPDLTPQRVVLTWSGDPATSMSVVWRTKKPLVEPFGLILEASHDPRVLDGEVLRTPALSERMILEASETCYYHTVNFVNLDPGRIYSYRVGSDLGLSEWNHFTTAKTEHEPFEFIYMGDAQNDVLSHWSRTIRQAIMDAPDAAFIVHAGDLVNHPNSDREWAEWFEALGWANRIIPCLATPGNHEYRSNKSLKNRLLGIRDQKLSRFWNPQFAFPENGPEGLLETVYYIDYQGVRFIALNSNEMIEEQVPWLEKVLSDNPNRWTVVIVHHPLYATRQKRDNPEIRKAWTPLFDKYGVDLVLTGHDHSYARTGKVHGNRSVANDAPGTIYVVSVSGPKMYEINSDHDEVYKMLAGDAQLYQILKIENDHIAFESKTCLGDLHDSFELIKKNDGSSVLLDYGSTNDTANHEIAFQIP